jgi:hypothetical protein
MFPGQDIEKSLSNSQTNFKCPRAEGHFPDPSKCDVYYQAGVSQKLSQPNISLQYLTFLLFLSWRRLPLKKL